MSRLEASETMLKRIDEVRESPRGRRVGLLGFGVANGVGFLALWNNRRHMAATDAAAGPDQPRPDGPFGDESGPVPTRSAAPLAVGTGVAVMALAGAFGPWFLVAGAVPFLMGTTDWLRSAIRELNQRARAD